MVEETRLVVLDHVLDHERVALARDHREMARGDLRIAGDVDALDLDARRDLPEHAGLPRTHEVHRPAVEAEDRDLVGLGLDRLEQLRREIRPCRLEHGIAVRCELGTHDIVQFGGQIAGRVEQRMAARLEHPLDPAVARQEGALAVLDRHAQRQHHGTSPSLAARQRRTTGFTISRTWEPDAASRKTDGPRLEPER